MALTREQSIAQYGTESYTGWGETEAKYDARAHPEKLNTYNASSSSGGGNVQTPEEYAKALLEATAKQREAESQYLTKAYSDNPFVFDEEAARKASTGDYADYYKTLLNDYLSGVELKRQNIQDEQKLLTTLRNYDINAKTRAADYAIENSQKGYAGQGLFFSGINERATGRLGIETKVNIGRAEAGYSSQGANLGRQEQTLGLEEKVNRNQIQQEQQANIESGINQRYKEQFGQYQYGIEQGYQRQFPSGQLSASNYLPSEYLRAY
jgi:hypothetical protein